MCVLQNIKLFHVPVDIAQSKLIISRMYFSFVFFCSAPESEGKPLSTSILFFLITFRKTTPRQQYDSSLFFFFFSILSRFFVGVLGGTVFWAVSGGAVLPNGGICSGGCRSFVAEPTFGVGGNSTRQHFVYNSRFYILGGLISAVDGKYEILTVTVNFQQ